MYATSVIPTRPRGLAALKVKALAGDEVAIERLRDIARMGAAAAAARGNPHRWDSTQARAAGLASAAARKRARIVA